MPAPIFDRSALKIKPLSQRIHDLSRDVVLDLEQPASLEHQDELKSVAESIIEAREKGSSALMIKEVEVVKEIKAEMRFTHEIVFSSSKLIKEHFPG